MNALCDTIAALLAEITGSRETRKQIGRLRSRIELVASDFDCDREGSLAAEIANQRDEINDLRARLDEWEPAVARDQARREGMR
jgi:uncharacterized membrane protein